MATDAARQATDALGVTPGDSPSTFASGQDLHMRIRALIAAFLFVVAVVAVSSPAAAHHRPGHTGGPGSAEDSREDSEEEAEEDGGAYGHGGEGEEEDEGAGVGISLAVITAAVVLIAAIGLKPGGTAPAHS